MSYPGNASLAHDIRNRILDTFQQTLKLVEGESLQEARLGCDFILRLDPMFEPARWLQDRLDSSDGGIVLDDLRDAVADARPSDADAPAEAEEAAGDEPVLAEPEPSATADEADDEEIELSDPPAAESPEPEAEAEAAQEPEPEAPADDSEAADGPAATQADYGEEQAPVPATAEEVMAAPVAALDTESEQRIQDLLAEGQTAFDGGEYQTAIDAWSRIFLIDIDHPEANERIEAARKLKAEAERTVEEAFHESLNLVEKGEVEEGRAGLERVLEMQPDHLAAREQIERLDSAPAGGPAPAPAPTDEALEPEPLAEPEEPGGALPDLDGDLDLDQPAPSGEIDGPTAIPIPKPRKQPARAADPTDKKKILLYVGAGLLVLVLVGAWFLISNRSEIFPNTTETVEAVGERPNPIERAEELHAAGKTSTAIAQLKRLPPHHELYSEAQALVAQWEAAAAAATEDVEPTEADLAEFEALLEEAKAARARSEFLSVDEALSRAAAIRSLNGEAAELRMLADQELEPIRTQVAIFRQGEWEMVLRDLWRMREDMPDNADLNRLMVDSYYNLGVRALQRGDTGTAVDHFGEALQLTAGDAELERANKFAETYRDRPEDLLYRIYVKYLPFR